MTVPTLVGKRVTLRAFRDDDRVPRQRYGWHREIERCFGRDRVTGPMSDDEAGAWLEKLATRAAEGALSWAIEADGELAGGVSLFDPREEGRKARLGIGMYAPQFLGRGLGPAAIRLVLGQAFSTLGMHRVELKVLDLNDRAVAAYRACGFVEEGRERESCWVDGRWHDDLVMGVLDREFAAVDAVHG